MIYMVKKAVWLLVLVAFILGIWNFANNYQASGGDDLLRFHVLANSDDPRDQLLKRKVRDNVLQFLGPRLEKASTPQQAAAIVKGNIPLLEAKAREVVSAEGFDYPVKAQVGSFLFPTKSYGDFVLPAGEYQAVRIVIGEGLGENWWCVLFPPLCFVDISAANPVHKDQAVRASTDENWNERIPAKIEFKWKIVEVFNDTGKKISEVLKF